MIADDRLRAWLADSGSQDRTMEAIQACARRWRVAKPFETLQRELDAMVSPEPLAVLDAARRFFDQDEALGTLIASLIEEAGRDPFFQPPFHPLTSEIHSGLLLFQHDRLSIGLGVISVDRLAAKKRARKGGASVNFSGMWSLFRYIKGGDALLSFWESAAIGDQFSAASGQKCRRTGAHRLADGEEILIDGRTETFVIDHAASDLVYLHAMVKQDLAPVTAEYDSDTLDLIGASASDEEASRIQMMATLVRMTGGEGAVDALVESLSVEAFFVRWHVMRELVALDAEAAYPHLSHMAAKDPHPELRAAAAQTLSLFYAEEEEEAARCRA